MISRKQPWENTLLDGLSVIEAMRKGGVVKRFHTHAYIIGQQTVAEHTFNMLCLCLVLHPRATDQLVAAILTHDIGEAAVGDVPSPAKWANPALRQALDDSEATALDRFSLHFPVSPEESLWLRFFDYFEGAMFARDQIVMGNIGCQIVFELYIGTLKKLKIEWNNALGCVGDVGWPEELETECTKLIQHYTSLTGEHIEWE